MSLTDTSDPSIPPGIEASPQILDMFRMYGKSYRWFAVATTMLASISTMLASTIINVAIPVIMGAFGVQQEDAQWLSTGYLAAGTVTMLIGAWAVETWGMRVTHVSSMCVFLVGSIIGGLAVNHEMLILARVVQGTATGMLAPVSMLINYQVFPVNRRGTAMGLYGIGIILAPALGPTVGGALIENYDWRYVFFLGIPFTILAVPMALMFLPTRAKDRAPAFFDWIGVILVTIALVTLLIGLTNGHKEGWDADYIVLCLGTTMISSTLFIWWELTCKEPILNLKLFLNGRFAAATIVTFVIGLGLYGSTFLVPLFIQILQGLDPYASGLLMLPAGLVMAVCFPIAGALSDRTQPRLTIILGLVLFGISFFLMRNADVNTPRMDLLNWTIIGRIGLSCIFPSLNAAALASLPLHQLSQGSGTINFVRQVGSALGVNLLSIFLATRTLFYSDAFAATQSYTAETLAYLANLGGALTRYGLTRTEGMGVAGGLLGASVYDQAYTFGFRDSFLLVACIFFLSVIPTWFMRVDRRTPR